MYWDPRFSTSHPCSQNSWRVKGMERKEGINRNGKRYTKLFCLLLNPTLSTLAVWPVSLATGRPVVISPVVKNHLFDFQQIVFWSDLILSFFAAVRILPTHTWESSLPVTNKLLSDFTFRHVIGYVLNKQKSINLNQGESGRTYQWMPIVTAICCESLLVFRVPHFCCAIFSSSDDLRER